MSQSSDPKRDALHDRLMDRALRETLGGETPPDLSDKILAAAEEEVLVSLQRKEQVMDKSKRGISAWALGAVAACLVVGVGISLIYLSAIPASRAIVSQTNDRPSDTGSGAAVNGDTTEPRPPQARARKASPGLPQPSGSPPAEQTRTSLDGRVADGESQLRMTRSRDGKSVASTLPERTASRQTTTTDALSADGTNKAEALRSRGGGGYGGYGGYGEGGYGEGGYGRGGEGGYGRGGGYDDGLQLWSDRPRGRGPRRARPLLADAMNEAGASRSRGRGGYGEGGGRGGYGEGERGGYGEGGRGGYGEDIQLGSDRTSGRGPGRAGDRYNHLVENPFRTVLDHPLSTFSIDVDTASYANSRRFLLREGRLPPPDAVRIEEFVNYFDYDYAGPDGDVPFAAHIEVAECPWKPGHRLVRVGLQGKEIDNQQRPSSNLVFLLDVSGSMNSPDKLPLLKEGMKLLAGQLRQQDRVAIVVYASAQGLVLPSTPGAERETIITALDRLQAGGSTNGGAGIELAYRIARDNFIPDGVNRVLLCTDGDFNVGTTSTGDLVRMVEEKARSGVFLSVLGFGRGNLNDAMMETVSNKGNGNYAYIDGLTEARKVLVKQMGGTLVTIAKDVKVQIEFNPAQVAAYRLIGYENRILAAEDFNDDKKDAGEIGAGHSVTALYEVVPTGLKVDVSNVDPLKYQATSRPGEDSPVSDELLTLKLRYKDPDAETSKLLEFPLLDAGPRFGQASTDFQFAAAVASFGMLLRNSEHKGTATYDAVLEIATAAQGPDVHGYRAELLEMVRKAKTLTVR
jgi:Ca-activated chloride channel family protein